MSVELNRTLDVAARLASKTKGSEEYFKALRAMIKHGEQSGHLVHSIDQGGELPVGPEHPLFSLLTEGKAQHERLGIGGRTPEELVRELRDRGARISDWALSMLQNDAFHTTGEPIQIDVVRVHRIESLGMTRPDNFDTVTKLAVQFGLDKLPVETGPNWRLAHMEDQPIGDVLTFASDTITDRYGRPDVFGVDRRGDERWLRSGLARPGGTWPPSGGFVFRLRKLETQAA